MTFSQLQKAMNYLQSHPEMHQYGGKILAKLVTDPKVSRDSWQDARNKLGLVKLTTNNRKGMVYKKVVYNKPIPQLAVGYKSNSTIVHIYVKENRVQVLHRGETRTYILRGKALDVTKTIAMYKSQGYRYTWLNENVILLTKCGKRAKQEQAA